MMIWLSLRGLTASEIAALFEYDPRTVRRWIDRYNREGVAGLEDRPRSGAPRLGGAGLGRRIRMLLREPGAWTVKQLRRRLGYPAMSLATLARRVREQASWRRPRLVAKGDPDEAAVLAALHQEIAALPERLLPRPFRGPVAGHRVPFQHALATAGLWTEVVEGCLALPQC